MRARNRVMEHTISQPLGGIRHPTPTVVDEHSDSDERFSVGTRGFHLLGIALPP